MKSFITVLLVALACLYLVQNADAWQARQNNDPIVCRDKYPDIHNAITKFCAFNNNLVS